MCTGHTLSEASVQLSLILSVMRLNPPRLRTLHAAVRISSL